MVLQTNIQFNTNKFQYITGFVAKIRTLKQCIRSTIGLHENFLSSDKDLRKSVVGKNRCRSKKEGCSAMMHNPPVVTFCDQRKAFFCEDSLRLGDGKWF
jgi:hypothetical protein